MSYVVRTNKSWGSLQRELATEFERWGVHKWETNLPRGAVKEGFNQSESERTVELDYILRGKPIHLVMGKQARATDNLRVLTLAIESMRLNEKRGIAETIQNAYLQIEAPVRQRSPWEVLGIMPGSSVEVATAVWKELSKTRHPDRGGTQEQMLELNQAIENIRKGLV